MLVVQSKSAAITQAASVYRAGYRYDARQWAYTLVRVSELFDILAFDIRESDSSGRYRYDKHITHCH